MRGAPVKPFFSIAIRLYCSVAGINANRARTAMVEARIKPHYEKVAEAERRAEQQRHSRRNQVFGLVIVALVVLIWTLFHTNPAWISPPGWWRP
jgi:hypothetical protein